MFKMKFISALVLTFMLLTGISSFAHAGSSSPLKIGVLRHLTLEQAEQINVDTQAERLLLDAANRRGHEIQFINPLQYSYSTAESPEFDVIISRAEINDPFEPVTDSYFRALDYFEEQGVPVINSAKATLAAQDKFRTLMLAQKAGVRIPLTFMVHSVEAIRQLAEDQRISYPFFIKNPYGGAGTGVFYIRDESQLQTAVAQSFKKDEPILVEERIDLETDADGNVKDMRLWVVRDAVTNKPTFVGGTYRTAKPGQQLTNLYAGGSVSALEAPFDPALVEMSESALESIGADVAGIDIGRDKSGNLYLIEVNISFYTGKVFQDAIGINIWELVMDLAEARAKS